MMEELVCEYQLKARVKRRAKNDDNSASTLDVGHDEGSSKRKFNSIYLQFMEDTYEDCSTKTELDFYLEERCYGR